MALLSEIPVPQISVNDTMLSVVQLLFAQGDRIKKGDNVLVFESSKTTYDVAAESDGFIFYLCEEGNDYAVNEVVAKIFSSQEDIPALAQPGKLPVAQLQKEENVPIRKNETWEGEPVFSHAAQMLLGETGTDKNLFAGMHFVSREDVERKLSGNGIKKAKAESTVQQINPVQLKPDIPVDYEKVIVEKLSPGKKREIRYLSEVQPGALTSTIHVHVDTEGIFQLLNRSLKYLRDSLLPVILYETGRLLKKYPLLNAYYTNDQVAVYRDIHVGFAIDLEKGLKVLKIAGTDKISIGDLEEAMLAASNRYLDDALELADLTDITFTVTDLSSEGVALFRPLVNMMNSAILGVSSIDPKLNRCMFSLTFDHRITEGKYAARFLQELKLRIESYRSGDLSASTQSVRCFKCRKSLAEDLADTGFVKCITPAGKEDWICQSCFKGF